MEPPDARAPLVVFVHVRKTAGKTLRNVLYREYGRDNTRLVKNYFSRGERSRVSVAALAADPGGLRVLHGHMLFWPELDWPRGTQFFTMLRDPVERTLSHYFWTKSRKPGDWPKTLDDVIADGSILDNFQTRTIADAVSEPGPLGRDVLERALERLDRFAVVGVTERFDDSLALLTHTLGWKWRLYERENTTRSRKARDEIPPETIQRIEDANAFDRELHRAATARLEADLAAQDDTFAIDLEAFKRALAGRTVPEGDGEREQRIATRAGELRREADAELRQVESREPGRSRLRRIGSIVQR